ncbi:MAG: YihY/virulence factor BrkB family protein [Candidatus Limnocylindria bacterium]
MIDRHLPKRLRPAWRVVRRTVRNYLDEEGLQWSGAVAFYLVLSVPPLLIAAVSIGIVLVGADASRSFLEEQVARFLPTERAIVAEIVDQTVQASGAAAMAAVGFLLFSGSRVFASLIAAINLMWHEIEMPGFWPRQLQRIGMVLTVGGLLVLAGVADIGLALASDLLDLPPSLRVLVQSQVVPALFIGTGLFLLFFLIPRRAATWRTALAGAIFGAVALRLAQALFTGYLRDFAGFDSAYGPIAGLAAVLTWALVASGIILLAAHFVAVLNSPDREPRPDEHQLPGEAEAHRRPKPKRRDD